jgi:hypothetical protein
MMYLFQMSENLHVSCGYQYHSIRHTCFIQLEVDVLLQLVANSKLTGLITSGKHEGGL